jgi:hypothetical protein
MGNYSSETKKGNYSSTLQFSIDFKQMVTTRIQAAWMSFKAGKNTVQTKYH